MKNLRDRQSAWVLASAFAGAFMVLVSVLMTVSAVADINKKTFGTTFSPSVPGTVTTVPASGTGSVAVDVRTLPSSDCWYEVGLRDVDAKPGGIKATQAFVVCP